MKTSPPGSVFDIISERIHVLICIDSFFRIVVLIFFFLIFWQENQLLGDFGRTERDLLLLRSSRTRATVSSLVSSDIGARGIDAHRPIDRAIGRASWSTPTCRVEHSFGARGLWKELARIR